MLREIKLYGTMGEKYGKEHRLDVDTPYLVISGLSSIADGFYGDWMDGKWLMLDEDGRELAPQEMTMSLGDTKSVSILPSTDGSFAAAFAAFGGLTVSSIVTKLVINLVITLALGAISRALAPSPKVEGERIQDNKDETRSFIFNGTVNVTAQGGAVPLAYGTTMVGSTVISAGVSAEAI